MVFVPLGSASSDFYGADRIGDDLYGNSLVALDANTGKRIWHYQTVHHDIWDRDLNSPPALVTVHREGKTIDAVAQTTKSGYTFLSSIARQESRSFPSRRNHIRRATFRARLTAKRNLFHCPLLRLHGNGWMSGTSRHARLRLMRTRWRALSSIEAVRPFIPGSEQGTFLFPGMDGGQEWGGPAYDPGDRPVLYQCQ